MTKVKITKDLALKIFRYLGAKCGLDDVFVEKQRRETLKCFLVGKSRCFLAKEGNQHFSKNREKMRYVSNIGFFAYDSNFFNMLKNKISFSFKACPLDCEKNCVPEIEICKKLFKIAEKHSIVYVDIDFLSIGTFLERGTTIEQIMIEMDLCNGILEKQKKNGNR